MSSSKNLDTKKTSFLNKSNSEFIEQMYLKFINNDAELPQSWKDYFKDLDEESNLVIKEINGPSWQRTKKIEQNKIIKNYEKTKKGNDLNVNSEKSHRDSVRAITLIRAYRTQGNLLAKLDPLGIKTSEYIDELHPDYHGFKREDYDNKIFLDGIINKQYANVREILSFLRKTYCGTIGYELCIFQIQKKEHGLETELKKMKILSSLQNKENSSY